ncbi:O-antigen ligase family protein [candidate division KSB1 bacterium]|nr:O-antigen ligase family protein [candidate division KSB1 bacterium]
MTQRYKMIFFILVVFIFLTSLFYKFSITNGIETAKWLYFLAMSGILLISAAMCLLSIKPPVTIELNSVDIVLLLFYLFLLAASISFPLVELVGRNFITCHLLLFYYWLVRILFTVRQNTKYLAHISIAFIAAGILQGGIALLQLYGLLPSLHLLFKLTGTFANPDALAGYITSITPFAFGLYLLSKDQTLKWFAGLFLILIILVLPATMIRNAWISSAAGILFILAHAYRTRLSSLFSRKLATSVTVAGGLLLTLLAGYALYTFKPDSIQGRFLMWKVSWRMFLDHPILGMGFGRYGMEYGYYQAEYFAQHPQNDYEKWLSGNVNHAHNEYLEVLTELGIPGLLLFLALIYFLCATRPARPNPLLISAKASLIGILIFMFGSFPLSILPTAINAVFIIAIIAKHRQTLLTVKLKKQILIPASGFMIIAAVLLLNYTIKSYFNYKEWHTAVQLALMQQYGPAVERYEKLYPHLEHEGQFLLNYGGTLSLMGDHHKAIELLQKARQRYADPNIHISLGNSYAALGHIQKAEYHYRLAYRIIPNRFYPLYLLTKLYFNHDMLDQARQMAGTVIRFREKVPSPAIDEMKQEIKALLKTVQADQ